MKHDGQLLVTFAYFGIIYSHPTVCTVLLIELKNNFLVFFSFLVLFLVVDLEYLMLNLRFLLKQTDIKVNEQK